uniref:Uncharacterized protein n=1 Tax=Cucumis sativus TaxID=3659 RepID=A0A0A0LB53_CUCSA
MEQQYNSVLLEGKDITFLSGSMLVMGNYIITCNSSQGHHKPDLLRTWKGKKVSMKDEKGSLLEFQAISYLVGGSKSTHGMWMMMPLGLQPLWLCI